MRRIRRQPIGRQVESAFNRLIKKEVFAPVVAMAFSAPVGYVCALGAVVGFGSNFIPVKKYDTGDGMFYQFVMCCAVWSLGLVLNLIMSDSSVAFSRDAGLVVALKSPPFAPLAMVGGFIWASGNVMSVPCINFIGMSLGLLIWGATNMVVGWASGRYGLFGLEKDSIANPALNYVGVALVLVCLGLFTRVETKTRADLLREADGPLDETLLVDEAGDAKVVEKPGLFGVGTTARRSAGIAMAVVSGVFYGSNFDPPQYVIERHADDDVRGQVLNYVFSHFTGILLTSTFYFAAYCAFKVCRGDAPDVRRELVGPAFASGLIWGLSDICWFVANEALSFSVSFPLVTSGPGFVAAAWGIFVYGEISGAANFRVLGLAFVILVVACALIVVSKN